MTLKTSNTCARAFKGIQGYPSVYRGIKGYTRVYRGIQGHTRVCILVTQRFRVVYLGGDPKSWNTAEWGVGGDDKGTNFSQICGS